MNSATPGNFTKTRVAACKFFTGTPSQAGGACNWTKARNAGTLLKINLSQAKAYDFTKPRNL